MYGIDDDENDKNNDSIKTIITTTRDNNNNNLLISSADVCTAGKDEISSELQLEKNKSTKPSTTDLKKIILSTPNLGNVDVDEEDLRIKNTKVKPKTTTPLLPPPSLYDDVANPSKILQLSSVKGFNSRYLRLNSNNNKSAAPTINLENPSPPPSPADNELAIIPPPPPITPYSTHDNNNNKYSLTYDSFSSPQESDNNYNYNNNKTEQLKPLVKKAAQEMGSLNEITSAASTAPLLNLRRMSTTLNQPPYTFLTSPSKSNSNANRKNSSSSNMVLLSTPFKSVIRKISKHVYFDRIPRHSANESKLSIPEGDQLEPKNDLYLYEEEMEEKLPATSIISALTNYQAAIPPNKPNASFQANGSLKSGNEKIGAVVKRNKLGTMMGVFLPCIQNIFGVILFLRMNWIVGLAGIYQAMLIILICCSVTFITAISMSAIATNGIVPAGGSYFMISRSLGPEFGGAVGFLFYLATTFAVAMYTIGAVEILLEYLTPSISIFDNRYHNFRVYGACFLVVMTLIVMVGVRLVNKIAAISLFCVLLSILTIYVGAFAYFKGNPNVKICLIGDQLIQNKLFGHISNCYKTDEKGNLNSNMWAGFCQGYNNSTKKFYGCEQYFLNNNVTIQMGIPGLGSGVFLKNLKSKYMKVGEANPGERAINKHIVQAYIATSFTILLGIYFPSVTGIMAGSNRSGDLADAQKSIPSGTLAAILFTSLVYISSAILFAASIANPLLRDKFGSSIGGGMIVANLGWPHPLIVTIGSFLSTIGAALQSLTGAPRLLQAIAKDNIVPFLRWFTKTAKNGEPLPALGLTFCISLLGIFIGNLDFIAPILTMFFLMCYGFVNLACALQTLLKTPNWRPRFKYYHWFLSLIGLALCVAAMFITSWYYALIAMALACALYKYIEYYGAEKEWGDGVKGLQLSTALFSLLRYENQQMQQASLISPNEGFPSANVNTGSGNQQHTKNWRPQLLVLCEFCSVEEVTTTKGGSSCNVNALNLDLGMGRSLMLKGGKALVLKYPRILSFAHQLKAGRGLTVCATALQGDWIKDSQESYIVKDSLKRHLVKEKVKGFCDVVMTSDIYAGVMDLIQLSGLGGLRHNCVMIAWPENWKDVKQVNQGQSQDTEDYNPKTPSWKLFVDIVRAAHAGNMAILVMKSCNKFPDNKTKLATGGTIDVWWIVHDGGLLMLLPFLLKQHKVWKHCTTRIFTVAQLEDNSVQLKKNLENFIYSLRIKAQVEVVEMHKSDISAYTYERTLLMEQRTQLLRNLNLSRKESLAIVQAYADNAHEKFDGHHSSLPTSNNLLLDNGVGFKPLNSIIQQPSLPALKVVAVSPVAEKGTKGTEPSFDINNNPLKPNSDDQSEKQPPFRPSIMDSKSLFQPPESTISSSTTPTSNPKVTSATNIDIAANYYPDQKKVVKIKANDEEDLAEETIPLNQQQQQPVQVPKKDNNKSNVVTQGVIRTAKHSLPTGTRFNSTTDKSSLRNNGGNLLGRGNEFKTGATEKTSSPFAPNKRFSYNKIDAANVKRMHAAIKLNQTIRDRSKNAQLVLLNMPGPPRNPHGDVNYMEYLEVLTEGLDRVLLIRGSGQEVVTIYS